MAIMDTSYMNEAFLNRDSNEKILNGSEGGKFSPEIHKFETDKDVEEFRLFILDRGKEIEQGRKNGKDVSSMIYAAFYNRNDESYKSVLGISPRDYYDSINFLASNLDRRGIEFKHGDENFGWFTSKTNGGFNLNEDTYRVYFNVKPKDMTYVFEQLAAYCESWGVKVDMKIPEFGNDQTLRRMDRMVMYYNSSEAEFINKILSNIHKYNHDKFEKNGIPRFTKKIIGMDGISVGQEPSGSKESFGQLRCKILAKVYEEYMKSVEIGAPFQSENFQYNFRYWCIEYGVNPDEPAFNLPVGYERS